MIRRVLPAITLVVLHACAEAPSQPGAALARPEIEAAIATCETKYAEHALTTFAQVAECERDLALPQEQRQQPGLAPLYAAIWNEKIELYSEVDQGRLSKAEADRQHAIDADNRVSIVRSLRRL